MVIHLIDPRCKRYDLSLKLSRHSLQTSTRGEASKIVKDGVKVTREIIKNEVSNKTKDIITEQRK